MGACCGIDDRLCVASELVRNRAYASTLQAYPLSDLLDGFVAVCFTG